MPTPSNDTRIPDDLLDLITTNVPAHLTFHRNDDSLVTHIVWVDYDGTHILVDSPKGAWKGLAVRRCPGIALSVMDPSDPWRRLSITGQVTNIRDDDGLELIDRLSQRYTGSTYDRRSPREVFQITPRVVRAYRGRRR